MLESLKDLNYGEKIIKKSLGHAIWYWFKYVLGVGIGGLVIGISALVYFTPQIPKFLSEKLPDINLTLIDGEVSTNMPEPYVWGDKDMALIINTKGTVDDLREYKIGVLILKDKIVAKQESETKLIDLSEFKDEASLSKEMIVSWTQNNKIWILVVGLSMLLVIEFILGIVYLIWQVFAFLFWSLAFFIVSKILKKNLGFTNILKIVLTASVVPLLISTLNILFQDKILDTLSIGIFVFYAGAWIYRLDLTKSR
jgi:hypothetical protein